MTLNEDFPPRRSVATAIALSLVLHLAVILCWRSMTAHRHDADLPETRVTVRLIPLQRDAEKTAPKREQPIHQEARADRPKPRHEPQAQSVSPASQKAVDIPPAPAAEKKVEQTPSLDAEELISSLRRDIGKIDRDLRKEHPNLPGAKAAASETKLARDIAATGKITGGALVAPQIEELKPSDGSGRRMYKVSFPGGHYCVTAESVGRRDGYDLSQSFHKAKVTNCPGDAQF